MIAPEEQDAPERETFGGGVSPPIADYIDESDASGKWSRIDRNQGMGSVSSRPFRWEELVMQTIKQNNFSNIHGNSAAGGRPGNHVAMRRRFGIGLLSLVLIASLAATASAGNSLQGNSLQGNSLQGNSLQGNSLQGNSLQGNSLQGNSLQGNSLQGNSLQGARLQGSIVAAGK